MRVANALGIQSGLAAEFLENLRIVPQLLSDAVDPRPSALEILDQVLAFA